MCGCFMLVWLGTVIAGVLAVIVAGVIATTTSITMHNAFLIVFPIVLTLLIAAISTHTWLTRESPDDEK